MNRFEKIIVEGKTTFELIGEQMVFNRDEMFQMMELPQLKIEKSAYFSITQKVISGLPYKENLETSRRYVIQHDGCETALQFFFGRDIPTLVVYMRSSSFMKLSSDLSFLSELAIGQGCQRLVVNFGSLHYIVGEVSYE